MRIRIISTALIGLAVAAGFATPAAADHVAEVRANPDSCVIGGMVSRIGPTLTTTDVSRLTTKDGRTTGYVCHFENLPPRSEWRTETGYLWGPPEKGVFRRTGFTCWTEQEPGRSNFTTKSQFIATPSGRATLICNLEKP